MKEEKKKQIKENEYQCAYCGVVYEKGWSDEEAKQEAKEAFGKHPDEWNDGQAIVCDDCYKKMLPAEHPDLVEQAKKII